MQKYTRQKIAFFFACLLALVFTQPSLAQMRPSAAQIEAFKQMSPEEQQNLAEQYGVNLKSGANARQPAQPQLNDKDTESASRKEKRSALDKKKNKNTDEEENEEITLDHDVASPEKTAVIEAILERAKDDITLDQQSTKRSTDQSLKQFGYDLFESADTTLTPATDIPIPSEYVLGPGDSLVVQLYGKENSSYKLVVTREGQIQFPNIGPVSVAGLNFVDARALIEQTINQQMIGVKAAVTMGELRSIRVFVMGDAVRPGSYTVSSLSTMTNALLNSGGISKIGSLRNIQLKRSGSVVATLDLYDLLLHGDTSEDSRLLPGDVIFIPPIGHTVGVAGEVLRPAIYELKGEKTASDAIKLAGGLLATAYPQASRIERISVQGERTLVDINLDTTQGKNMPLRNADIVQVFSVLESMEDIVLLEGHIGRPGAVAYKPGMRVSDVIPSAGALLPNPDLNIALIERETRPTRQITVLAFNLGDAISNRGSASNLRLEPRDKLYVFDFETKRTEQLKSLIQRMKLQASKSLRKQVVSTAGSVRFPGEYPFIAGMSTLDLISMAGGLTEQAYGLRGEITRVRFDASEQQSLEHLNVNLSDSGDTAVEAQDQLQIKRLPNWIDEQKVTIEGEVAFPGIYKIKRGETLSQVVARAGGLNQWAYPEAAIFSRKDLRDLETERLQQLKEQLESDIAAAQTEQQSGDQKIKVEDAQLLLKSAESVKPLGRMVIDLDRAIKDPNHYDIVLRDQDALVIPAHKQAVTVVGEVQFATSHLYEKNLDASDYIERSGGTTMKADKKRIYVVKANGRVFLPQKSGWFRKGNISIEPGDTVVVPLDADRIKSLTLWTSATQIFYQIALGAAAVASF